MQQRLGNISGLASQCISELQQAQIELEQLSELPWFLLSTQADVTNLATALDTINLPTGFIRMYEEDHFWLYTTTQTDPWIELFENDWKSIKEAQGNYTATFSGTPGHYAIVGSNIYIGPLVPTEQKTFKMRYYKKATTLSTNVENNWLANAPEVLISYAGIRVAAFHTRDEKAEAAFTRSLSVSLSLLNDANEQRKHSNRSYVMEYA